MQYMTTSTHRHCLNMKRLLEADGERVCYIKPANSIAGYSSSMRAWEGNTDYEYKELWLSSAINSGDANARNHPLLTKAVYPTTLENIRASECAFLFPDSWEFARKVHKEVEAINALGDELCFVDSHTAGIIAVIVLSAPHKLKVIKALDELLVFKN